MIRYIRVLGAALGGLVGLALAAVSVEGRQLFTDVPYSGAFLAAWVVVMGAGLSLQPLINAQIARTAGHPVYGALISVAVSTLTMVTGVSPNGTTVSSVRPSMGIGAVACSRCAGSAVRPRNSARSRPATGESGVDGIRRSGGSGDSA